VLNKKKFIIFYVVLSVILYLIFDEDKETVKKENNKNCRVTSKNETIRNKIYLKAEIEESAYIMCKMLVAQKLSPKVSIFPYMDRNTTEVDNGFIINSTAKDGNNYITEWSCRILYKGGEMRNPNSWDYNLTL
jgi:hypothetical protein